MIDLVDVVNKSNECRYVGYFFNTVDKIKNAHSYATCRTHTYINTFDDKQ